MVKLAEDNAFAKRFVRKCRETIDNLILVGQPQGLVVFADGSVEVAVSHQKITAFGIPVGLLRLLRLRPLGQQEQLCSHCLDLVILGYRNTRMIEEVYGHLAPDFRAAQMRMLNIMPGDKKPTGTGKEEPPKAVALPVAVECEAEEVECAAAVPELAGKLAGEKIGQTIKFVTRSTRAS